MPYEKIGGWAFILGVLIAILAGLASGALDAASAGYVTLALVILGLVVGFLNIGDKEVNDFLLSAVAVVLIGTANLNAIPVIGTYLALMVLNVAAFVAPAALVVALKAVYNLASKPSA
ncbi:MAG: hypothetical protein J7K54_05285 [Candidatus Aenigmarchaeota archaeon]|nr:hypothetical protein [Candidatus Aenigmarchaeota archaeon]